MSRSPTNCGEVNCQPIDTPYCVARRPRSPSLDRSCTSTPRAPSFAAAAVSGSFAAPRNSIPDAAGRASMPANRAPSSNDPMIHWSESVQRSSARSAADTWVTCSMTDRRRRDCATASTPSPSTSARKPARRRGSVGLRSPNRRIRCPRRRGARRCWCR